VREIVGDGPGVKVAVEVGLTVGLEVRVTVGVRVGGGVDVARGLNLSFNRAMVV